VLFLKLREFNRPKPEIKDITAHFLLDLEKSLIPYLFERHISHITKPLTSYQQLLVT
jgi:hypothetical protein